MITPGAAMGVTDFVLVAGVPAAPDSITAVLYRWVGGTRSASGVTVTPASTATPGEYKFTWTNDGGWSKTDELELVAIPVKSSVNYPATIWRSHGGVDAVMRGTDSANTTAPLDAAGTRSALGLASANLDTQIATLSTYDGSDTSGVTTLLARLTSTRAGLLDNLSNLDVAVSVLQTLVTNLTDLSSLANWFGATVFEIPDSGTATAVLTLVVKDAEGKLVDLDASPTLALTNTAGTDRSSILGVVSHPSTGTYKVTATWDDTQPKENLTLVASGTVSAEARVAYKGITVADFDTASQINTILTRLGTPSSGSVASHVEAVESAVGGLQDISTTDVTNVLTAFGVSTFDASTESVDLGKILGTALTEGAAGRLAAAFITLFNVTAPVLTAASVNQTGDAFSRIGATGSGLTTITGAIGALNNLSQVQAQTAATDALVALGLQYLFQSAYDPTSKPGNAAGYLNVIVENDAGVPRATANFLEQAPAGGGGGTTQKDMLVETTIATLASQTSFTLTAGTSENEAYKDLFAVITDASTATQKAKVEISAYTGSSRTVTLKAAPTFTIAVGDTVAIFAAPTADLTTVKSAVSALQAATSTGAIADSARPPGRIRIRKGRSYLASIGTQLSLQPKNRKGEVIVNGWPDLTGATITVGAGRDGVENQVTGTGSVQTATGTQLVYLEFDEADNTAADHGVYEYEVKAVLSGGESVELDSGELTLLPDYAG